MSLSTPHSKRSINQQGESKPHLFTDHTFHETDWLPKCVWVCLDILELVS